MPRLDAVRIDIANSVKKFQKQNERIKEKQKATDAPVAGGELPVWGSTNKKATG
jgi:hypothetical protein